MCLVILVLLINAKKHIRHSHIKKVKNILNNKVLLYTHNSHKLTNTIAIFRFPKSEDKIQIKAKKIQLNTSILWKVIHKGSPFSISFSKLYKTFLLILFPFIKATYLWNLDKFSLPRICRLTVYICPKISMSKNNPVHKWTCPKMSLPKIYLPNKWPSNN